MTLTAGNRLGPYTILAPLGAGGMGEVYRARDERLSRDVAIKVLPAELAGDPSRLARFEREARSASALNHPNIVTIHDIGSAGSVSYMAMELVAGETLQKLLVGGALPIRRLLQIAPQIAEGLAKAHEAGIVHRDLKPANVMVTRDGVVKILDFGLAKLAQADSGSDERSPLAAETLTRPGSVVGTVGYMSPEQATGDVVDFRSDQFSFGSILYEMATGKRAFQGKTDVDTLSAILNQEPAPIAAVNAQAPAPLRWIVERCLAKDPAGRYGTTGDLARDLVGIRDHLSEAASISGPSDPHRRRRWRNALTAAAVAALLAVLAAGVLAGRRIATTAPPSFKRLTFQRGNVAMARFTGDGQTIIYGASWNGQPWRVYSTRRDGPETTPLLLPDAFLQSISRSGELAITLVKNNRPWAMATGGTLARAPLSGGAPREVLEDVRLADWSADGSSLLVVRGAGGKTRLEYPIGSMIYETPGEIRAPRVSPRGDQAAFLDNPIPGDDGGSVAVVDREGRKRTLASGFTSMSGLAWTGDGREVWFSASRQGIADSIYAVSLSGRERLLWRSPSPMTLLDMAADGSLLVRQHSTGMQITGLAPGESRERDLSWLDYSFVCDLSSDGTSFTFDETGAGVAGSSRLYLGRTDGSLPIRLFEGGCGALSPDGLWVLSVANAPPGQLVLVPTKSGQQKPISFEGLSAFGAGFFPDGQRLLLAGEEPGHGLRFYVGDLAGGRPRPITPEGIGPGRAVKPISPDGQWVFASGPDGGLYLYPVEERADRAPPGSPSGRSAVSVDRGQSRRLCHGEEREWSSPSPVSTSRPGAGNSGRRSCRRIPPASGALRASSSPPTTSRTSTRISERWPISTCSPV